MRVYFSVQRHARLCIAIIPYGRATALTAIDRVFWLTLQRAAARSSHARCDAIVADFSADMPDEWEAFLADAALAGKIVYQVKQLVGIADRTGRARPSFGKQLRLAASGARLFPFEGTARFRLWRWRCSRSRCRSWRWSRWPFALEGPRADICFARTASATPATASRSSSSGRCGRSSSMKRPMPEPRR